MKRCGMATDPDGLRYWLPQCMGGAVYGPDGCTCSTRKGPSLEDRVAAMEKEIKELREALNGLLNTKEKKQAE